MKITIHVNLGTLDRTAMNGIKYLIGEKPKSVPDNRLFTKKYCELLTGNAEIVDIGHIPHLVGELENPDFGMLNLFLLWLGRQLPMFTVVGFRTNNDLTVAPLVTIASDYVESNPCFDAIAVSNVSTTGLFRDFSGIAEARVVVQRIIAVNRRTEEINYQFVEDYLRRMEGSDEADIAILAVVSISQQFVQGRWIQSGNVVIPIHSMRDTDD